MGSLHSHTGRQSKSRWMIGALLVTFYLFLSIALFSPLHQHNQTSTGIQCTLNNFEHQVAEGAVSVFIAFTLILLAVADSPVNERKKSYQPLLVLSGRAPPFFSFS